MDFIKLTILKNIADAEALIARKQVDYARLCAMLEFYDDPASPSASTGPALDAHLATARNAVPLKQAAAAWGVSEHAALKRAQRGFEGAFKREGRWYVRADVLQ
jgi:hypothetical protein